MKSGHRVSIPSFIYSVISFVVDGFMNSGDGALCLFGRLLSLRRKRHIPSHFNHSTEYSYSQAVVQNFPQKHSNFANENQIQIPVGNTFLFPVLWYCLTVTDQ